VTSISSSSAFDRATLENEFLRVQVLSTGGQIAEILDKQSGVNPLWNPPWREKHTGSSIPPWSNPNTAFLNHVGGHYVCLDLFGEPSSHEVNAGLGTHGEACITHHELITRDNMIVASAVLPLSQLKVIRRISLEEGTSLLSVQETIENLVAFDRPIAWTQHVTVGAPFLTPAQTRLFLRAHRSRTHDKDTFPESPLIPCCNFEWPIVAACNGTLHDLSIFSESWRSCSFSAHLIDATLHPAAFIAYSPQSRLLFGYRWNAQDFPWISVWEENRSRIAAPWNGDTQAWGLEFGASPFPMTRRQMVERGMLFDTPVFTWLGGRERRTTHFTAFLRELGSHPNTIDEAMSNLPK